MHVVNREPRKQSHSKYSQNNSPKQKPDTLSIHLNKAVLKTYALKIIHKLPEQAIIEDSRWRALKHSIRSWWDGLGFSG